MAKDEGRLTEYKPAVARINTGALLDNLLTLMRSNMAGDGEYSIQQINAQAKLSSVCIRVVELELKMNKSANK